MTQNTFLKNNIILILVFFSLNAAEVYFLEQQASALIEQLKKT